jgi:hypothetical protein
MTFDDRAIWQQLEKYIDLGLHPIPLIAKKPCCPWKEFTLTKKNMYQYANRNWGLRTERINDNLYFFVIDFDHKELMGEFWGANTLPELTPVVSTGRGFHFYFTWNEPVKTTHFKGMDIIGNDAYVVAPPSLHPNGKYYQFLTPFNAVPPLMDVGKIILPQKMTFDKPVQSTFDGAGDISTNTFNDGDSFMSGVDEGNRHNTLVRYISILMRRYFTEREALVRVLSWNEKNRPPLPKNEVICTVHDCYNRWGKEYKI